MGGLPGLARLARAGRAAGRFALARQPRGSAQSLPVLSSARRLDVSHFLNFQLFQAKCITAEFYRVAETAALFPAWAAIFQQPRRVFDRFSASVLERCFARLRKK